VSELSVFFEDNTVSISFFYLRRKLTTFYTDKQTSYFFKFFKFFAYNKNGFQKSSNRNSNRNENAIM